MWAKNTDFSHEFFREWREEWNKCRLAGIALDQMSLFYLTSKYRARISELDGVWNVSVNVPQGMRFLDNAVILHYWNSGYSVYRLGDPEIQKKGYKSDEVRSVVADPLSAFYSLKYDKAVPSIESDFKTTSTYIEAFDLYKNRFRLFRCVNFLFSLRSKIRRSGSDNRPRSK